MAQRNARDHPSTRLSATGISPPLVSFHPRGRQALLSHPAEGRTQPNNHLMPTQRHVYRLSMRCCATRLGSMSMTYHASQHLQRVALLHLLHLLHHLPLLRQDLFSCGSHPHEAQLIQTQLHADGPSHRMPRTTARTVVGRTTCTRMG